MGLFDYRTSLKAVNCHQHATHRHPVSMNSIPDAARSASSSNPAAADADAHPQLPAPSPHPNSEPYAQLHPSSQHAVCESRQVLSLGVSWVQRVVCSSTRFAQQSDLRGLGVGGWVGWRGVDGCRSACTYPTACTINLPCAAVAFQQATPRPPPPKLTTHTKRQARPPRLPPNTKTERPPTHLPLSLSGSFLHDPCQPPRLSHHPAAAARHEDTAGLHQRQCERIELAVLARSAEEGGPSVGAVRGQCGRGGGGVRSTF